VCSCLRTHLGRSALVASLAALLLSAAGCASRSHAPVFTVSVLNDTQNAVVVRDCDDFCSSSPFALNLSPGASAPVNRTTNQHKYLSIKTSGGDHVGCLDLYFARPEPGTRVPVSGAIPCPPGSGRPWTGIALVAVVLLAGLALAARLHNRPLGG